MSALSRSGRKYGTTAVKSSSHVMNFCNDNSTKYEVRLNDIMLEENLIIQLFVIHPYKYSRLL